MGRKYPLYVLMKFDTFLCPRCALLHGATSAYLLQGVSRDFFFFFVFWSCLVHLVWVSSLEALNGTWSNVFVAVVLFRFPLSRSPLLFPLFLHASAVLLFRISFGFLTNRHIKFVFAVLQTLIIMSNLFLLLPLLLPLTSSSSSTYFSPLIKYDKTEVDIVVIYVVWLMLTSA